MRTKAVFVLLLVGCGSTDDPKGAATTTNAGQSGNAGAAGSAGSAGVPSAGSAGKESAGAAQAGVAGMSGSAASTAGAGTGGVAGAPKPTTTIRVHYPTTKQLTMRGDHGELSWTAGVPLQKSGADTWTFTSTSIDAPTEVKPLLEDATWSKGPNFRVKPGATVDVYPRFVTDQGKLETFDAAFKSPKLPDARAVWAYLPPTYVENAAFQAPVLYMHDGQNVFGQPGAFGDWQAATTLDAGAATGDIDEVIVVGIANTAARLDEYTPTFDMTEGFGGKGAVYLSLVVDDLKPKIDKTYRTRAGRETTGILGSSLGGLISSYAGVTHAETFGIVGAMSPSTWWDNLMLVDVVTKSTATKSVRVYVDSGDAGPSNDGVGDTKMLADAYAKAGYVEGKDLHYVVDAGGQHNEASWAKRLPGALSYMLGPRADLR